jgi:hypothetical protein
MKIVNMYPEFCGMQISKFNIMLSQCVLIRYARFVGDNRLRATYGGHSANTLLQAKIRPVHK